ncbi:MULTISPECIES: SDR family oxidoreductase [Reichenbachiella]|uniref:Short-chain dehydrogenase n=1 Tax=Reichenbachiella agariperforans TaxID=156994 RepID=A0A1M6VGU6_REIAG|nr:MULTISPECIES: SDR family oxidoreductase [Reichenbachiella]MBU2914895.1 SDR family oxidoreductase [Reichenbachiella agariperforans]RJE75272.1 short-chain dehydrogenase [Reichenbachiella sp. MSK19-1]SHK80688.1 Short-chain dehydrogenase [Reichenbachiella agariperforans]
MKYFEGKHIWIVGASSGLGEGLTHFLSDVDCTLVLSARREEELIRVREANKDKKAKFVIAPLDLAQPERIDQCVAEVEEQIGYIDIMIQSGGISQRDTVLNTSMEVQRQIMEVNYFGAIHLSRAVLPKMVERQSGMHVVVTSAVGIISTPFRSGYSASKHALHGFYDALRAEQHQNNVKVTLLCPGYVHTNISYNALMGDGSQQQKLDNAQANGLSVEQFCEIATKAIAAEKEEVYIGGFKEVMGIYVKRFFPGLFSRIVRKIAVT